MYMAYRGEFHKNQIHGKGALQGLMKNDATSLIVYAGDMKHGRMHGGLCACGVDQCDVFLWRVVCVKDAEAECVWCGRM